MRTENSIGRAQSQEPRKGGFSEKGVFGDSSEKTNLYLGMWPQQYIWHSESHGQKRRIFFENPLLKTPFSWFLTKGKAFAN